MLGLTNQWSRKANPLTGYTAPSANYTVTQPALSGNITSVALTITGVSGSNKVYDRTTTASLSGTPAYSGLVNGETFAVSGTPVATFASATVGTVKAITVTGYTAPSANYSVNQPTGLTADITQKPLTVTGATVTTKTYNGSTAATITGASVVAGVISPDVVTVSGGGTFADANVGTGIAVATALTLGGANAASYSLTQPTGLTGNITIASQTITFATLADKLTSDAPFALTGTASSGLTVSYASDTPAVATVSGSTVTIVGPGTTTITASQAGNGNYTAATSVNRTLTVTAPTVLAWELNAAAGSETSVNSTTTATGVNTSALTRGAGVTATALADSFNSTGYTLNGTAADAILNNKYVQFTVNATSGKTISLSTLDANFRRSSAGPISFQWQYSLDGFATAGVNIGTAISYTGTATLGAAQTQISLSGISGLQNVVSSTTITIRLYGSGATSTGGTFAIGRLTGDDLIVRGVVATAPAITGAATASPFTTTYGTASAEQTFSVSGANLIGSITATAPTGFEVSNGGAYGATTTFTQSGGNASGTLHLRLKTTAVVGGNYNSQPVALTSSGATTVNITTAATGNTVTPAATTNLLVASANPVATTSNVTFVATISGSTPPTGSVLFKTNGMAWGSAVTLVADGKATNSTTLLPHGTIVVTAEYSGDGNYLTSTNTLSLLVNSAPVGGVHAVTTRTNLPVTLSVSKLKAGDSDADNDSLSLTGVANPLPSGAAVSLVGNIITYTPPPDTFGAGSFTYTLADGFGGVTSVTVSVTITDPTAGGVSANAIYAATVGSEFVVHFAGVPGQTYTVEHAPSPTGPWAKLANFTAPASINDESFSLDTGIGVFEVREITGGSSAGYYRTVSPSY